jgi:hypothetical protein
MSTAFFSEAVWNSIIAPLIQFAFVFVSCGKKA